MSQHQGGAPDCRDDADLQDNEQQKFRNVHRTRKEVNGESRLRMASQILA
jgi:hypothetical protein